MKITQIKKELSQLNVSQLIIKKDEIAKKLFDVKMEIRLGKTRDTALIHKLKRIVACINTYIAIQVSQSPL